MSDVVTPAHSAHSVCSVYSVYRVYWLCLQCLLCLLCLYTLSQHNVHRCGWYRHQQAAMITTATRQLEGGHFVLEMSNEAGSTCLDGERMENSKTVWVIVWRLQVWHVAAHCEQIVSCGQLHCFPVEINPHLPGTNYKRWVPCRSWVSRGRGDTIGVFIVIVDVEKLVVSCWLRMLGIVFWAAACLRTIARTCGTLFSQHCRVQGLVLLQHQTQIYYFLFISKHFN